MDPSERIGVLAALAAGVLWGFLGIFVRYLSAEGFSPVQMTCIRYIIVAIAFAAFIILRHRRMLAVDRSDIVLFAIIGIVGTLLNSVCYFGSMERISLSLSTVLQYLSPFIVVALSVPLFHEKLTRSKLIAVVVAFLGCILCTGLITAPGSMDLIGIALGTASGLFYSLYTLGSKKAASKGRSTPTIMLYSAMFCAIGLAPFANLPSAFGLMFASWQNLAMMLGLGVLMTLVPFGLYNVGINRMEAGKAAIITFVEPFAATVVGFIVFGEAVTPEAAVGMVMILLSLFILERKGREDDPDLSSL